MSDGMTSILAVNWEAFSAIGQIVGALAVVISLIYVASEVRRNTRATQPAAMRSMSSAPQRRVTTRPKLAARLKYLPIALGRLFNIQPQS